MGKAAENERIKLGATFYNNLAVGLTITGLFVPYLTLVQGTFEARVMLADFLHGNFSQFSQLGPLAYKLIPCSGRLLAQRSSAARPNGKNPRLSLLT
jgi:hypothetical protein